MAACAWAATFQNFLPSLGFPRPDSGSKLDGGSARAWAQLVTPGCSPWAGPPTLLPPPGGSVPYLGMSSGTRHALEQMEVAAGRLAREQTRNYRQLQTSGGSTGSMASGRLWGGAK